MMLQRSLCAFLILFSTFAVATTPPVSVKDRAPIIITGDNIQPLSSTHWRIKVDYEEAVKVRCVAFDNQKQAVAIDSIAVIPPFSVSNMHTQEADNDIHEVTCWVISTREEDLAKDYIN